MGTQHGTRPPNVFVQSESSSDAERVFSVMNDNYHGRSWTRMKDCPRVRTMLSLLDAELEQILSVNKEVDVRHLGAALYFCQLESGSPSVQAVFGLHGSTRRLYSKRIIPALLR